MGGGSGSGGGGRWMGGWVLVLVLVAEEEEEEEDGGESFGYAWGGYPTGRGLNETRSRHMLPWKGCHSRAEEGPAGVSGLAGKCNDYPLRARRRNLASRGSAWVSMGQHRSARSSVGQHGSARVSTGQHGAA